MTPLEISIARMGAHIAACENEIAALRQNLEAAYKKLAEYEERAKAAAAEEARKARKAEKAEKKAA